MPHLLTVRRVSGAIALVLVLTWISIRPSNDRDWSPDQTVLPSATFEGDQAHVTGIRNARYRTTQDFDLAYYDKTFDLSQIETLWFVMEPFSEWKGAAHTLLSFGFANGDYVAISAEIRKEKGEKFSSIGGLFKRYELMYVVGDERDVIGLRANIRKDDVYVYPVKAPKQKIRELFVSMLERANHLKENPEFYNTLWNTCTTNIVSHVNDLAPGKIPFSYKVLLPGYSDVLAYDLGLIDTDLPFEEAKKRFHINDRAEKAAESPQFSASIRNRD